MLKCKACGADIVFVRSRAGKSIPCDAGLIPFWANIKSKTTVVTQEGDVVHCDLEGDPEEITNVGYIPHWATCTNPDRFRKRGNK